jgi:hypothetical protein
MHKQLLSCKLFENDLKILADYDQCSNYRGGDERNPSLASCIPVTALTVSQPGIISVILIELNLCCFVDRITYLLHDLFVDCLRTKHFPRSTKYLLKKQPGSNTCVAGLFAFPYAFPVIGALTTTKDLTAVN